MSPPLPGAFSTYGEGVGAAERGSDAITPGARGAGSGRRAAAIFSAGRSGASVPMPAEKMAVDGPEQVRLGRAGPERGAAADRGLLGSRRAAAGLCWAWVWSGPGGHRDSAGLVSASPRGWGPTGACGRPWGCGTRLREGVGKGKGRAGTVRPGAGGAGPLGLLLGTGPGQQEVGGWVGGKAGIQDLTQGGRRGKWGPEGQHRH